MSEWMRQKWSLKPLLLQDLVVLCANMRPDEIEQWQALIDPEFNFEKAAAWCYQLPGVKFGLWAGDTLLCAGGYYPIADRVWRSWMVGTTAHWATHWRSITEGTRFVMDCLMQEEHIDVLETQCLASRTLTRKWYEKGLKLELEGILRKRGVKGEDIAVYSRLANAPENLADALASQTEKA